MNYFFIYTNLIRKARVRQVNNPISGYKENHHIIPKCLLTHKTTKVSNGRWNLVQLTAREHFIAHRLLYLIARKRYGKTHRKTKQMLHAFGMFFKGKDRRKDITAKEYEVLRQTVSNGLKGTSHPTKGRKRPKLSKENNPATKSRQKYKIYFIDGRIIKILGINKFAAENGYSSQNLSAMASGKRPWKHKDIFKVEKLSE